MKEDAIAKRQQLGKKKGAQRRARAMMRKQGAERLDELPKTDELETLYRRFRQKGKRDMSRYRVDANDEVVEMNASHDLSAAEAAAVTTVVADYASPADEDEATSGDDQGRSIKAQLRKIALRLVELESESDPPTEEIGRLKKRYRELVDRLRESPGGDAPVRESYPGDDLTEQQGPGAYRGVEWVEALAAQPDTELPDELREDAELHAALREEGFAQGDDLSDEEMWSEFVKTLGEES